MENRPETSVLMSVYNTERYLKDAIASILSQTYRNFEFIIVNDGSTDRTRDIVLDYKKIDGRIVLIDNERNIGVTKSLNIGLRAAKGDYIARMDPDDISLPGRLGKQLAYMKANPDIGLLGTYIKSMDENGRITGSWVYPSDDISIKWRLLFANALAHPSVVYRKELAIALNGYNEELESGIDFDLWVRMSEMTKIHQLNEFLVMWRTHPGSITFKYGERRKRAHISIIKRHIEGVIGREITGAEAEELYRVAAGERASSSPAILHAADMIEEIRAGFIKKYPGLSSSSGNRLAAAKLLKIGVINIWQWPGVSLKIFCEAMKKYFSG